METMLQINNQTVRCELRKVRRSRRVRISLRSSSKVLVTLPFYVSYKAAEQFLYKSVPWIASHLEQVSQTQKVEWPVFHQVKARAKVKIVDRLKHWNTFYKFTYHKVTIRQQSTRWGSCSNQGNLNFNYRLYALPDELLDYVVVHELCHLREHNHSHRFWRLVAEALPDFRKRKKQLQAIKIN